jgi:hypothetical protein
MLVAKWPPIASLFNALKQKPVRQLGYRASGPLCQLVCHWSINCPARLLVGVLQPLLRFPSFVLASRLLPVLKGCPVQPLLMVVVGLSCWLWAVTVVKLQQLFFDLV